MQSIFSTNAVEMQIAKENSLDSKDLRNVEQSSIGFFIVQWDLSEPLNRLMYKMNCGVRYGCGIPFPKCTSTSNGLHLWFKRVTTLKQGTCWSPDYNGFLLTMKFIPFQGLVRAHVIWPSAPSLMHLFFFFLAHS